MSKISKNGKVKHAPTSLSAGLATAAIAIFAGGVVCSRMLGTFDHYGAGPTRDTMRALKRCITYYRKKNGGMPPRTAEDFELLKGFCPDRRAPNDAWGHPFRITHVDDETIIVSLGRDGAWGGSGEDKDLIESDLYSNQVETIVQSRQDQMTAFQ